MRVCGYEHFLVHGQAVSLKYFKRGGVIMQDTELVIMATLCFVVEIFTFQLTIHTLKTTRVLVCGQSIIHNYLNFL